METEIIQKIKSLGVNDQDAKELYELISQEVLDILFEEIAEKSTDEELRSLEQRIGNAKSPEHFESIIKEIATTLYEDNVEEEIKNIYLDLIDSVKVTIQEANDLLKRANSGDQDAQKLLEEAKQTDTYQNIVDKE